MCGHFGWIANKVRVEKKKSGPSHHVMDFNRLIFDQVVNLASQRGPDGFGLWNGEDLRKHTGKPQAGMLESMVLGSRELFLMGHCRLHTEQNTAHREDLLHPFRYGHIILAHNGYIKNWPALVSADSMLMGMRGSGYPRPELDSQALAMLMNLYPDPADVLRNCDMDNSYAIVYHNLQTKELHILVRNMPFYMAKVGESTYWCSKPFTGAEEFSGHAVYPTYSNLQFKHAKD